MEYTNNTFKKFFYRIAGTCLSIGFMISVTTYAQNANLWDWLSGLTDQIPFGYKNPDDIVRIADMQADSITLESTVIKGELGENILNYMVMYGQSPLSEILVNASLVETTRQKQFTFGDDITSPFSMQLTAADGIDPNQIYYISVIPRDLNAVMGEISQELCFQLANRISGIGRECETTQTHSAGADMTLANITHVQQGSTVRLQWTAVQGSDRVDLFLYDEGAQNFNRLATVNMSDENYAFTVTRDGEHSVRFTPLQANGQPHGRERVYTFTVTGLTPPPAPTPTPSPTPTPAPQPEITTVPQVGPAQNIAIAVFISLLVYGMYRIFRKKHI